MRKKVLAAIFVFGGGMLLLPMTAKGEEVTLKDMGNGFYLPASFDLKTSDGSLMTSPKICPTYTSALAGQPLTGIKVIMVNDAGEEKETVMYFTDAHIDIMEDENVLIRRHVENADGTSGTEAVIHYDVIKKQCPLYLYDEMFASAALVECRSPKAEEMLRKQEELDEWIADLTEQNETIEEQLTILTEKRDTLKARYGMATQ